MGYYRFMARRTKVTNENPQELTAWFLANYTMCEGLAEDIGYSYVALAPIEVVQTLLARRPWPSETVARMLQAILRHENLAFPDTSNTWNALREARVVAGDFDLVAEWKWATRVRNDLAHSAGQWKYPSSREGVGSMSDAELDRRYPELWELFPRSRRHEIRELKRPMTVEQFFNLGRRFSAVHGALTELAAHVGVISLNGYIGPGPTPADPTLKHRSTD